MQFWVCSQALYYSGRSGVIATVGLLHLSGGSSTPTAFIRYQLMQLLHDSSLEKLGALVPLAVRDCAAFLVDFATPRRRSHATETYLLQQQPQALPSHVPNSYSGIRTCQKCHRRPFGSSGVLLMWRRSLKFQPAPVHPLAPKIAAHICAWYEHDDIKVPKRVSRGNTTLEPPVT